MRSPARPSAGGVGYEPETGTVLDRHNTQQLGGWRAIPATHTGADRIRTTYH